MTAIILSECNATRIIINFIVNGRVDLKDDTETHVQTNYLLSTGTDNEATLKPALLYYFTGVQQLKKPSETIIFKKQYCAIEYNVQKIISNLYKCFTN